MGWLDGALRLMPNWEWEGWGYQIPNPFWGAVLLPGITFVLLYGWPWIEARVTKDHREHHVLDRPRDRPMRTALGVTTLTFYTILGVAASNDVLALALGISLNAILIALRIMLIVVPPIAGYVAYRLCKELQKRDGPFVDPQLADEPASGNGEGSAKEAADLVVADADVP
jgi:ubiquinol-cytochrome c reductase cytochrome b subunit